MKLSFLIYYGNSARRFFKHTAITSKITGVNEELIKKFSVILRVLSCESKINVTAFEKYCSETAELYVSLYKWYPMPVTVHKILIHGALVIENFLIPIGQLSEDVQESRHKEFRQFRLDNSRKVSRTKANTDILHNLLISSDPLVTSLMPNKSNKLKTISQDIIFLLEQSDSPFVDKNASTSASNVCEQSSSSESEQSADTESEYESV